MGKKSHHTVVCTFLITFCMPFGSLYFIFANPSTFPISPTIAGSRAVHLVTLHLLLLSSPVSTLRPEQSLPKANLIAPHDPHLPAGLKSR